MNKKHYVRAKVGGRIKHPLHKDIKEFVDRDDQLHNDICIMREEQEINKHILIEKLASTGNLSLLQLNRSRLHRILNDD